MGDFMNGWRRFVGFLGVIFAAVGGCRSRGEPRSEFERDPLVMSHLTHRKDDPAFAETETDVGRPDDGPTLRPASVSKKPGRDEAVHPDQPGAFGGPSRAHAPDYSWLRGTLTRNCSGQPTARWFIQYANAGGGDRFDGVLPLANAPRLGLLREGDRVELSGRVVEATTPDPQYYVESLALVD